MNTDHPDAQKVISVKSVQIRGPAFLAASASVAGRHVCLEGAIRGCQHTP